jgi:excisionase family DNA binding protein
MKPGGAAEAQTPDVVGVLAQVTERLACLEEGMAALRDHLRTGQAGQDWFTTKEVARLLGRTDFTVRQWCNLGRLRAQKTGNRREWRISRAELDRYRKAGLRPG